MKSTKLTLMSHTIENLKEKIERQLEHIEDDPTARSTIYNIFKTIQLEHGHEAVVNVFDDLNLTEFEYKKVELLDKLQTFDAIISQKTSVSEQAPKETTETPKPEPSTIEIPIEEMKTEKKPEAKPSSDQKLISEDEFIKVLTIDTDIYKLRTEVEAILQSIHNRLNDESENSLELAKETGLSLVSKLIQLIDKKKFSSEHEDLKEKLKQFVKQNTKESK